MIENQHFNKKLQKSENFLVGNSLLRTLYVVKELIKMKPNEKRFVEKQEVVIFLKFYRTVLPSQLCSSAWTINEDEKRMYKKQHLNKKSQKSEKFFVANSDLRAFYTMKEQAR